MAKKLDFEEGKEAFLELLGRFDSSCSRNRFMEYVKCRLDGVGPSFDKKDDLLEKIREDLRTRLPLEGQLPSETISFPNHGPNGDCDPWHTIHLDAFLYEDASIDELCDEGKLVRNYCKDCGSHNTEPITYISHSMSVIRMQYVFGYLLPKLDGKMVLDVGSRLGAVLYGAHVYSRASAIIGIEMNEEFINIQREIITKYNLQSRIQVFQGDICFYGEIVKKADVVILNNVFDFFLNQEGQIKAWQFLKETIKSGTLLVTVPSLEDTFSALGIVFEGWVTELKPHVDSDACCLDEEELTDVLLYRVN